MDAQYLSLVGSLRYSVFTVRLDLGNAISNSAELSKMSDLSTSLHSRRGHARLAAPHLHQGNGAYTTSAIDLSASAACSTHNCHREPHSSRQMDQIVALLDALNRITDRPQHTGCRPDPRARLQCRPSHPVASADDIGDIFHQTLAGYESSASRSSMASQATRPSRPPGGDARDSCRAA